jgi:23S rRNA pseudouridine1911/1915/1917 synthase
MPRTDWGWLVTPDELETWIVAETEDLLVVNKRAHVVCHPSKHGPWSSLVGACREFCGSGRLHLVSRLDRETSGVVVLARNPTMASLLQKAMEAREAAKTYVAILEGIVERSFTMQSPIGPDTNSAFVARQWTVPDGKSAETRFEPLASGADYTVVRVTPVTGRRHQIRVHAAAAGHPIVGDKLYCQDASLMVEFIANGFTSELERRLLIDRQALHALEIEFPNVLPGERYRAEFPADLRRFCQDQMKVDCNALFPFDGARRLVCHVVEHGTDTRDFQ